MDIETAQQKVSDSSTGTTYSRQAPFGDLHPDESLVCCGVCCNLTWILQDPQNLVDDIDKPLISDWSLQILALNVLCC